MNTVAMLVLSIQVGFFGFTTTNESKIEFENRRQCISHLDILEKKYGHHEITRNESTLKVTDHSNHAITIFKCPTR